MMSDEVKRPTLHVGKDSESRRALTELRRAGFQPIVKHTSVCDSVAYRTPVLFGLYGNKFEGLSGIRIFIENSKVLGLTA